MSGGNESQRGGVASAKLGGKKSALLLALALCAALRGAEAFAPSGARIRQAQHVGAESSSAALGMSTLPAWDGNTESLVLTEEEVSPIIRTDKGGKEKVINAFGLWTLVVSLITGPVWAAAMSAVDAVCGMNDDLDPHRVVFDGTGKIWSKTWLTMSGSYPEITGDVDRLKEGSGPCLFVANHASWLDIPVLCTVLDPVFKFISKAELQGVPCIGQQLTGGKHILIDRSDRRSQLRTFKDGIGWLKKGVPLMAFPEGMRSPDGRLMDFKGGIFSMAVKTKVPIVPISVANTHAVMPANALFPVQSGAGKLRVHVHEPIDTEGLDESEIAAKVKASLLSMLPPDQHPLPEVPSEEELIEEIAAKMNGEAKGMKKEMQPTSS